MNEYFLVYVGSLTTMQSMVDKRVVVGLNRRTMKWQNLVEKGDVLHAEKDPDSTVETAGRLLSNIDYCQRAKEKDLLFAGGRETSSKVLSTL